MRNINIDMLRTLSTKRDRNRVLGRFLTWAKEHGYGHLPEPSVIELRWNDEFTLLWVSKTSGLIEHGFDTQFPEHGPVIENENWAIYTDENPAARMLLAAISDVTASKILDSMPEVSDG